MVVSGLQLLQLLGLFSSSTLLVTKLMLEVLCQILQLGYDIAQTVSLALLVLQLETQKFQCIRLRFNGRHTISKLAIRCLCHWRFDLRNTIGGSHLLQLLLQHVVGVFDDSQLIIPRLRDSLLLLQLFLQLQLFCGSLSFRSTGGFKPCDLFILGGSLRSECVKLLS